MIEPGHCLICYQNLDELPLFGAGGGVSSISRELNAVFILRDIFEVPSDILSSYLEDSGGTNPSELIRLCGGEGGGHTTCKLMVDKAKRIYKEILETNRRFRKVKGDIIQFLRRNQRRLGGDRPGGGGDGGITNQTRKFVSEHDYSGSLVDPFIGGDCQAEKLLYSSNIVPEIDDDKLLQIIKVERGNQEDEEIFYEDKDNLEENSFMESGSPPSAASNPGNDDENEEEDDKNDPLYNGRLKRTRKRVRRSNAAPKNNEQVVPHIPSSVPQIIGEEPRWSCSCGKGYSSQMKLRRHVKEATMEESCMHPCPLCGKGFRRKWDWKRHLRHTHGKEEGIWKRRRKRQRDPKLRIHGQ